MFRGDDCRLFVNTREHVSEKTRFDQSNTEIVSLQTGVWLTWLFFVEDVICLHLQRNVLSPMGTPCNSNTELFEDSSSSWLFAVWPFFYSRTVILWLMPRLSKRRILSTRTVKDFRLKKLFDLSTRCFLFPVLAIQRNNDRESRVKGVNETISLLLLIPEVAHVVLSKRGLIAVFRFIRAIIFMSRPWIEYFRESD